MRMLDVHSHMSTREGYLLQEPEKIKALSEYYKQELTFSTEEEMYQEFKKADVKVIISPPLKTTGLSLEWLVGVHDYTARLIRAHPDVYENAWILCDPRLRQEGLDELNRCVKELGMLGPYFFPPLYGIPYNDKLYYPYYDYASQAGIPVLLLVGLT